MKTLLILVTVLVCSASVTGQEITVKTRDGKEVSTTIRGITNKAILTAHGEFTLKEIETVTFPSKMQKDQGTYDRLEAAGAAVVFSGAPIIPEPQVAPGNAQSTPIGQGTPEPVTTEQVVASLEAFRQSRQIGMVLELVGTAMVVAGAVVQAGDTSALHTAQVLVVSGAALSLIGFVVSFSAGSHLRFDR